VAVSNARREEPTHACALVACTVNCFTHSVLRHTACTHLRLMKQLKQGVYNLESPRSHFSSDSFMFSSSFGGSRSDPNRGKKKFACMNFDMWNNRLSRSRGPHTNLYTVLIVFQLLGIGRFRLHLVFPYLIYFHFRQKRGTKTQLW